MDAYIPTSWMSIVYLLSISSSTLAIGWFAYFFLPNLLSRLLVWPTLPLAVVLIDSWLGGDPAGFRMLGFCISGMCGVKTIVLLEHRIDQNYCLSFLHTVCFSIAWIGMDPSLFHHRTSHSQGEVAHYFWKGTIRIFIGLFLVGMAKIAWDYSHSKIVITILILPGISLVGHFGLLNWMVAFWRYFGVESTSFFEAPLFSRSLSEFWGRRWNIPFSQMVRIAVYQPLSHKISKNYAGWWGFMFSGLLHEMAISLPVHQSYGLPLLYFFVHGILMVWERTRYSQDKGPSYWGVGGTIWCIFWLVLPMGILFHPAFLAEVIWPIIGVYENLPK